MNRRFKRRKSNYVVRKYVKRCLTFPVITKRKLKPQWGLTSASSQGGGIHTRFTLLPGTIKTLDKPYNLRAFKQWTGSWPSAIIRDRKEVGWALQLSGYYVESFRVILGEGDPDRTWPSSWVKKTELKVQVSRAWGQRRTKESHWQRTSETCWVSQPPAHCLRQVFSENWSRQVRRVPQAKERNSSKD